MKRETIALHAGYQSEPTTKSAAVPIYQTTSYTFDNTQHGADLFNLEVAGNIYLHPHHEGDEAADSTDSTARRGNAVLV